jgi:hypothetical protein
VQRLEVRIPRLITSFSRACTRAVKAVDIIDEMFIDDIVSLEWEVLRRRRLKRILMQETWLESLTTICTRNALRTVLRKFFSTIFRKRREFCADAREVYSSR